MCIFCLLLIPYGNFPSHSLLLRCQQADLRTKVKWRVPVLTTLKGGEAMWTPCLDWQPKWQWSRLTARVRGESTPIWQGAQISFHLRCTLKGDRHHPSCQEDVSAIRESPGEKRTQNLYSAIKKQTNKPAVFTDRAPNDLIMTRNKCHWGESDVQMPLHN